MTTIVHARVPAYYADLNVRPAKNGVRIEMGQVHMSLKPAVAYELVNAIVDILEQTEPDG